MDQAQDHRGFANAGRDSRNAHVQEVTRQAHEELRLLIQKRAEVVRRIGTLKQTIVGLANLFGEGVLGSELQDLLDRKHHRRQPGFTNTCRTILMECACAQSARGVEEQIRQRMPLMIAHHKDSLASVTTVLNRLAKSGEARIVTLENGRRAWQWVQTETSAQSSFLVGRTPESTTDIATPIR
jgi:hypothetical protein